jgi:hypothetical protein
MKHTPGPWRWEYSESSKQLRLCGGKNPFDLTIIDFVREGMQGATMRLRTLDNEYLNIMKPAKNWAVVVDGREHHKKWFQNINHADAKLIAAAPDLLEALKTLVIMNKAATEKDYQAARDAIKKATT